MPGAILKSERSQAAARRLRREPTYCERLLWKELKQLEVSGAHFRRQVPFGSYIADFACHRSRVVIEVDGGVHDLPDVAVHDMRRDEWLGARGYRVLRFANSQVENDRGAVLRAILGALGACTPTPGPSPQGGGGKV